MLALARSRRGLLINNGSTLLLPVKTLGTYDKSTLNCIPVGTRHAVSCKTREEQVITLEMRFSVKRVGVAA